MPIGKAIQQLSKTMSDIRKPGGTPASMQNAKKWNAPGGGYDQWKKGDAAREKALPIGGMAPRNDPAPKTMSPLAAPRSFKKGGTVKKTGMAKVHKGEVVIPKAKLQAAGKEIKNNPPKILAKTKKKSGAKQANKQRVAILLSKARRGPKMPPPQPQMNATSGPMPMDPGDNQ